MKKKVSIFKKIKLFWEYKKILKPLKVELNERFATRLDGAYRLYTVINIPSEEIGEPYNIRKNDIDRLAESYIRNYSLEISNYLNDKGLKELYDFYEVSKVAKYSYLVVIGFSLLKSNEYYDKLRFWVIPVLIASILIPILLFLFF